MFYIYKKRNANSTREDRTILRAKTDAANILKKLSSVVDEPNDEPQC